MWLAGSASSSRAADLAAAAALLASIANVTLPAERIYFGEISLSGAVRASPHMGLRLKEAQKLGFTQAVIPAGGESGADARGSSSIASAI